MNVRIPKLYHEYGKGAPYLGKESQLQISFVTYLRRQYPRELFLSIPNEGKRTENQNKKLGAMGMMIGAPDLIFPVPRGRFSGLAIELKAGKGSVRTTQKISLNRFQQQKYFVAVCWNFDSAKKIVDWWYQLKKDV